MVDDVNPVETLDDDECWELLELAPMGRIALAAGGEIDIFPINFAVHDGALYFRTAPGTKLVELTVNPQVALEIDGWDAGEAYSVVVKGEAERLEHAYDDIERRIDELAEAEELAAVRPELDGAQIMALLGLKPGPEVGRAYAYLLELRLDEGPIGEEAAAERLRAWYAEQSA